MTSVARSTMGIPVTLTDIGHRPGGTGIHFNHVNIFAHHDELDINQADYMKGFCQPSCIFGNGGLYLFTDGLGRVYGNTVAGVDACTFDMLHDSGDQDVGAVADRIHLQPLPCRYLSTRMG